MARGSGCRGIVWVLVFASVGCSDSNGSGTPSGDSNATTTGTPATPSTNATTRGTSTSGGGAATSSSVTSTANTGGSGGSNTGGSGDSGASSVGGLAGADTTGDTTGTTTETVEGDACSFTLTHTRSSAIGTVEIVTWSTDLSSVTEAHIDFGLTDSDLGMSAPVDLEEPDYRTLLLGMKGDRSYSFRIVASSEDETCTGPELSFMTGPVPDWVPTITKTELGSNPSKGFIITTPGLALLQRGYRNLPNVFIFDTDGDVVWWIPEVFMDPTGARMSWDGKTLVYVNAYAASVFSVSMDGLTTREFTELAGANHDLTLLPDGGIVTMLRASGSSNPSIVELKADGTVVNIVPDVSALYTANFHPNAIHYHPADNSFTLSDLELNGFVKFTRDGELLWQLGGKDPIGDSFDLEGLEPWLGNHGHHLTSDGHLLFFNNWATNNGPSRVLEVLLDETDWTATKTWEYVGGDRTTTFQLGDVQRLPNGNAFITYSNSARMLEVDPSGDVVQSFENDMFLHEASIFALFGYTSFRTSLYGPPPR